MAVDRSIGAEVAGSQRRVIVAWDTCTTRGVLAVGSGERLLAAEYFESVKGHTGWLMPQMNSTLEDLGLTPSGIDCLAAGIGPGTFTGVKVGVACAKALSFGLDKPLVALPTLDVLAASAQPKADVVLSTIDARRGQLYAAVYRQGSTGRERATDFLCLTEGEVADLVTSIGFKRLSVVGELPARLVQLLGDSGEVEPAEETYPNASALLELALEMSRANKTSDALAVSPIYLKKPT
jgi:tRNA threonylcarbamoyladenosine biosynthesis protein TsaB